MTGESRTLAEDRSAELVEAAGVPVVERRVAADAEEAVDAAVALGFPVVVKLCGDGIAHKSERGLVRLRLRDAEEVRRAAAELLAAATPGDADVRLLVAPMLSGTRELVAGLERDPHFGPVVMLGIGGVLAEAVDDVTFRLAPLDRDEAVRMPSDLEHRDLLGPIRGEPGVDSAALADTLVALSRLGTEHPEIRSVDCNPLVVVDGHPIAVDVLVEVAPDEPAPTAPTERPRVRAEGDRHRLAPLFEPRGVVVAGASSHPGKFGFVALHNILRGGYRGPVFAINRDGAPVLGLDALRTPDELPVGAADLVVVCTPPDANLEILRACARRKVRAAFVASGGYGEAGGDGPAREQALVHTAAELDLLLAGPNGQGLASTPVSLCAQIVAPVPPRGHVAVASQSGNLVSTFENLAGHSGVGISRAVSAGNAAVLDVADYLDYFGADPETRVAIAYVEDTSAGRRLADELDDVTAEKPVVVLQGGTTGGGRCAAASHTGALATEAAVLRGVLRQVNATPTATVHEAFDAAATFATQPLPRGPRTAVLTTVGGWGVLSADAIVRSELELAALPAELREALDAELPPRWSRNNPVDLAGGETRDTVARVLELLAEHPAIDAILLLGLGVQSNEAHLLRTGPFYEEHGLHRIVEYHERQDARVARAAAEASTRMGKPVLVATELATTAPENPGPDTVRATGRYCYPSADRAIRALEHAWRYARARARTTPTMS